MSRLDHMHKKHFQAVKCEATQSSQDKLDSSMLDLQDFHWAMYGMIVVALLAATVLGHHDHREHEQLAVTGSRAVVI